MVILLDACNKFNIHGTAYPKPIGSVWFRGGFDGAGGSKMCMVFLVYFLSVWTLGKFTLDAIVGCS